MAVIISQHHRIKMDHEKERKEVYIIVSLKNTDADPTGFIFDASGKNAYVNIMHRATGQGSLLKISGFKIGKHE